MKTHQAEILLYYDPKSSVGKKTLAYAKSLTPHIRDLDVRKVKFTTTLWKQLLTKLDLLPKHLLNKAHPYYQENIRNRDYDEEGWLNILIKNPDLLIAPIAVNGNKAMLCKSPIDIYRFLQVAEVV